MMSSSGEGRAALELMQDLVPGAQLLGLSADGLPNAQELNAYSSLIAGLQAKLIVVGEEDGSTWRVASYLDDEFRHADVEGRATIVGKVTKAIKPGRWQPFLTFPGLNLIPRAERRRMESTPPPEDQENMYLKGPAVMLDTLAIYR